MFEEFRSFIEVVERRNFTKAAKHLNFTQPTVSQHVKKLEILFNTTLIKRISNHQLEITREGEIVYHYGKQLLELCDKMQDELERSHNAKDDTISIVSSMTIANHILPEIIKQFYEMRPDIKLKITVASSRGVFDMLAANNAHIGFIEDASNRDGFELTPFFNDDLILVSSPQLADDLTEFSPAKLGQMLWILRDDKTGINKYVNNFTRSSRIKIQRTMTVGSNFAVKNMVKAGLGITFTSKMVVYDDLESGSIVSLPLNKLYTRKLTYVLPEGTYKNELITEFVACVDQVSQRLEMIWGIPEPSGHDTVDL